MVTGRDGNARRRCSAPVVRCAAPLIPLQKVIRDNISSVIRTARIAPEWDRMIPDDIGAGRTALIPAARRPGVRPGTFGVAESSTARPDNEAKSYASRVSAADGTREEAHDMVVEEAPAEEAVL